MKIEQLIIQYLYSNKKVTLQDIGTFTFSEELTIPLDSEKDTILPADSIQFECNRRAKPDESLITYIMEHTRKIRPLASSDLESFILLSTQFLNIGKPLILEGLGTLQKTQGGEYEFIQAGTSHVIFEETPKLVTEKQKETISFASPKRETGSNRKSSLALWGLIIILLIGACIAAYYFINHNKDNNKENPVVVTDTSSTAQDSISSKKVQDNVAAAKDTNSFYVVIKEFTDSALAGKSLNRLTSYGNKVELSAKDPGVYKVRMPFMLPLTDTLRVKDSLAKFFKARTYVELP